MTGPHARVAWRPGRRPVLEYPHEIACSDPPRTACSATHTLYNLIDRRHGCSSTAITSNIELSDWGRYLGDATLTAAILDRIVMNALRFNIDGPSYRQHVAAQRVAQANRKASE